MFPEVAQIMRPIGALGFGLLRRDGTSKRSLPRYDEQPGRTAAKQNDDMPCVCWSGLSASFRILHSLRIISNTEIAVQWDVKKQELQNWFEWR